MKEKMFRFIVTDPDRHNYAETKNPPKGRVECFAFGVELRRLYPNAIITAITVSEKDIWAENIDHWIASEKAWQEIIIEEEKIRQKNEEILSQIATRFGKAYRKNIEDCLKESEFSDHTVMVICKEPKGDKQDENWKSFKHIYVNQTENGGYSGDSFSGTIYIPLPDKTFLEFHYSM